MASCRWGGVRQVVVQCGRLPLSHGSCANRTENTAWSSNKGKQRDEGGGVCVRGAGEGGFGDLVDGERGRFTYRDRKTKYLPDCAVGDEKVDLKLKKHRGELPLLEVNAIHLSLISRIF